MSNLYNVIQLYTINYNYKHQLRHAFMRMLHLFIMYLNLIVND